MATSDIKPDIEAAERLGILVVSREGLDRLIDRTLIQPNADQIYSEAEQSVGAAVTKYETQPTLPLNDNLVSPS